VRRSFFWSYHLNKWLWAGLDLLYPPECGGCGKSGYRWCPDCQKNVLPVSDPKCDLCGLPQETQGVCASCRQEPASYQALRSWLVFEGSIRKAVHRVKYRRDLGLGDSLATQMLPYLTSLDWPIDIVTPVPLGKKRYRQRGYNQVGLIARPLALAQGWDYAPRVLRRARETISQVGLSASERKRNVRGAFVADSQRVRDRRILIMDDVVTTGATLAACAQALMGGGAREVYALTVARALPRHGLTTV